MTNLGTWLPQGRGMLQRALHCFSMLRDATLDYLLDCEARIDRGETLAGTDEAMQVPTAYDTLMAGEETPLQRKLDWWSRFQLAQGRIAEISRALVSIAVVGTAFFLIELDSTGTFDKPEYRTDRTNLREVGKLCEGQMRSECVSRAISYFGGSASQFVSLLESGCRRNDFRNCGFLGNMYQAGDGVPADINQARIYLEKGCAGSDAQSCNMLAILMASESAPESWRADASAYFQKACDLQELHGCLNLASRLLANPYGSPERTEAVGLLERACQGGVAAACEWDMIRFDVQQVGRLCQGKSWAACFDAGSSYMAAPSKLVELLDTDCERGQALSCQFLGIVFGDRTLPLQDPVRSRSYLQKACIGGLQQAC